MGLDSIEIILEIENAFGISIPDRDAGTICTVGDCYQIVWDILNDSSPRKVGEMNRNEVERIIAGIIALKAGVAISEVTPQKKIGDDLGID